MKLLTSLVSVKRINSSVPRSNFNEQDIEEASQAILEAEGIINPIILEKTSLDSYEVFSGYFEYYAAVRAREIDPRKGEMISAFIIEDDKENAIKKQVKLLRKSHNNQSKIIDNESNSSIQINASDQRFSNIEKLNEQQVEIKPRLPEPIDCLEALNTMSLPLLISNLSPIKIKDSILKKLVDEREKNGKFQSPNDVVSRVKGLGDKTMNKITDHFSR